MSRLYLVCAICDRRQADGLISGAAWGRVELPSGVSVDHPAVKGSSVLSCPTCVSKDARWQEAVLVSIGVSPNGAREPG
jgi:hypothetical protein